MVAVLAFVPGKAELHPTTAQVGPKLPLHKGRNRTPPLHRLREEVIQVALDCLVQRVVLRASLPGLVVWGQVG